MNQLSGYRIVESSHMTEPFEDWSRVRSPARARRRLKRGFKQNIKYSWRPNPSLTVMGDTIYAHPETVMALERELKRQRDVAEAMVYLRR